MREEKFLKVKVFWIPATTKDVFFEGEAKSVSSENSKGNFDILPNHANFITLILNELTIIKPDNQKIVYKFKKGVLETSKNKVNIFLGF